MNPTAPTRLILTFFGETKIKIRNAPFGASQRDERRCLMMEMLNIKSGPRRPNRRRKEKAMKNITRTTRILSVEYPVKTENGFETRTANVIDKGAAAIRAELKEKCAGENM